MNLYSGSATLYLTGTFSITNSTKFCGVTATATCDFTTWQPNSNMLIIVAHGDNGSGYSISMANSTKWQGGFYTTKSIDLGQSSIDEGPMFSGGINIGNSVPGQASACGHEPSARRADRTERARASPGRPTFSG